MKMDVSKLVGKYMWILNFDIGTFDMSDTSTILDMADAEVKDIFPLYEC